MGYNEHFYSLTIASNAVRLAYHDDRTLAVDNNIVDCVLHKVAKAHGFDSYPQMYEQLRPGVKVTEYMAQRSKHGGVGR